MQKNINAKILLAIVWDFLHFAEPLFCFRRCPMLQPLFLFVFTNDKNWYKPTIFFWHALSNVQLHCNFYCCKEMWVYIVWLLSFGKIVMIRCNVIMTILNLRILFDHAIGWDLLMAWRFLIFMVVVQTTILVISVLATGCTLQEMLSLWYNNIEYSSLCRVICCHVEVVNFEKDSQREV